ncbi:hypothetical protein FNV43_RR02001 [Rhamnella rubrinervis]|uniref:Uncharacterized protein n=1 Tax=Rhamnella rubrinervis TaxID=2594499 RepID=A0A8K0HS11_9ROSA|nr:hypothetical protein FNV43_RR02001 [Rhamnella rubrinervis]
MSYLKERFDMPSQIKLSAPGPLERADSPRDGWICLYEIAFKIGLRLPFHRIINMVLNFYTSNLSERLRITAEQKNVIRTLLRTKTKSLLSILSEDSFRSARYWLALEEATLEQQAEQNFEKEDPSTQQSKKIPEGIPLPILEVPYLHVLEGCIRLLYGVPTDPLWASYPAADMGKLKMKISKAELEAIKKKKKDKQAAAKGGTSSQTDKGEERPTSMVVVEPSFLPIAIPSGDSPPSKRPRRSSPPAPAQDKGKEKQTPSMLGLEDSSTIRSDSSLVGPIVDSLMTRHDRSLLREMALDEVGLEAEQNALKLTQDARYLYDAIIKVDKAFKKKVEAYINVVAANKTLEENSLALKQTAMEAMKRAEQLERKWSEADQKLIEKDRKLEAFRLDYAQVTGERETMQARVAQWPRAKKHIYKKAAIDAILKNTNDMIMRRKGGLPHPTKRRMVKRTWRSPRVRMSRMTEIPLL